MSLLSGNLDEESLKSKGYECEELGLVSPDPLEQVNRPISI